MRPDLVILSGGQTGADQGALRAARAAGLSTAGWAPRCWMTEAGPAPWLVDYGLRECPELGYPARTRRNVAEATAVLWFGNPHSPGGKLTLGLAAGHNLDTFAVLSPSAQFSPADVADWLLGIVFPGNEMVCLLCAGNRESSAPGIGARAEAFLADVFLLLKEGAADA